MGKNKRCCMAVTDIEYTKQGDSITVCGIQPLDKPSALYVPLCAAHRIMAEVRGIKVFTNNSIADYRL